jgi:hypothetical protein
MDSRQSTLNKIPTLDKGWVMLAGHNISGQQAYLYASTFLKRTKSEYLENNIIISFEIKAPLFVQLSLSEFGIATLAKHEVKLEAYIPTVSDIKAKTLEISTDIKNSIDTTSAVLLQNPSAMQYDGCDAFISQITLPISTYTHLLATSTLKNWLAYIKVNSPSAIQQYKDSINGLIKAEFYKFLEARSEEKCK